MTDMTLSYPDLIKEAFIKPIRNVTVIDDEYPTLLSFIDQQNGDRGEDTQTVIASRNANIERLKQIITMCHSTYKWSVDVFDGQSPNFGGAEEVPSHIHHSDLIVLDYHLDGDASADDGMRARRIIQSLDRNNHYNLTLVHTKGYIGEIEAVFNEILKDFIRIEHTHPLLPSGDVIERMDDWLDANEDGRGYQWINVDINLRAIFDIYFSPDPERSINPRRPAHPLNVFISDINDVAQETGLTCNELMKWRFKDILNNNRVAFQDDARSDLEWCWDTDTNYISTGKTFISVIKKSAEDPEDELIGSLRDALTKHNASPMHLLMAKMRYELDEKGIEQASKIINNRYAQAGWLYNLLQNASNDSAHDKAINLHWEQLATASRLVLRDFSKKIIAVAEKDCPEDMRKFVQKFFNECMDNKDLALGHLNAFSCSMSVSSNHLITGTILDIEGDKWVCITPACDLVPGQKVAQWKSRIGKSHMVFKAIRFIRVNLSTANENANLNEYIFINMNGEPQAYWLGTDNPVWDTFYATDLGAYGEEHTLSINCVREDSEAEGMPLVMRPLIVHAVAELRYEYALNLLHKFGSSQTRVGLDFQDIRSMWV